jgi:hypothetical protein
MNLIIFVMMRREGLMGVLVYLILLRRDKSRGKALGGFGEIKHEKNNKFAENKEIYHVTWDKFKNSVKSCCESETRIMLVNPL